MCFSFIRSFFPCFYYLIVSSVILFLIHFLGNIMCGTSRPFFIFGVPSGYVPDSKAAGSPNPGILIPGSFGIPGRGRRFSRNSDTGSVEFRRSSCGKSGGNSEQLSRKTPPDIREILPDSDPDPGGNGPGIRIPAGSRYDDGGREPSVFPGGSGIPAGSGSRKQ